MSDHRSVTTEFACKPWYAATMERGFEISRVRPKELGEEGSHIGTVTFAFVMAMSPMPVKLLERDQSGWSERLCGTVTGPGTVVRCNDARVYADYPNPARISHPMSPPRELATLIALEAVELIEAAKVEAEERRAIREADAAA